MLPEGITYEYGILYGQSPHGPRLRLQNRQWYLDNVGYKPGGYKNCPKVQLSAAKTLEMFKLLSSNVTVVTLAPTPQPVEVWDIPQEEPITVKKKGNTMYYDDCDDCPCTSVLAPEKRYLVNRLNAIRHEKYEGLRDTFHIGYDDAPRTLNDFIARIKDAKFELDTKDLDKDMYYGHLLNHFEWRSAPADRAGFDAADKRRMNEGDATLDIIMVSDLDKGLAALQAFEATDFSKTS